MSDNGCRGSVRLYSLDVLRGLDMLLLTVVGPIVQAAQKSWKCFPEAFMRQFSHGWECFTLWDIIMPLFIFMCGAAVPFSLPKRLKDGRPGVEYWRHVLCRVAMLWVCGMLIQGRLLSFDPLQIGYFTNTLQAIAVGYLFSAAAILIPKCAVRAALTVSLFLVYAAALHLWGDYTPAGNLTAVVERKILAALLPAGSRWLDVGFYTWILPSVMFAAMTMCGVHAAEILRSALGERKKALALFGYALLLLSAGWAAAVRVPVIKPIYTVSFTLQAMGWSVASLAGLYVLTDVWRLRRGLALPVLFGQCALTAYMATNEPFRPALRQLSETLTAGMAARFAPRAAPFMAACAAAAVVALILMARRRIGSGRR